MNSSRVAFHTLGCKLNFAETSTLSRMFEEAGYVKAPFAGEADIYVINSCSVTDNADKECRSLVRGIRKRAPEGIVIVTGCYAQLKPYEIAGIDGVDLVLGAREKFMVLDYIRALKKDGTAEVKSCEIAAAGDFHASWSAGDRTRAFLKVQDGCDYSCTFCTIPLARGKSRSDTIGRVIENINKLESEGIREIVLTGINLGDFGKGVAGAKKAEVTFTDLVKEINATETSVRFRISSIEPNLLTDEIIELVGGSSRFAPHFHIPLQSGSDKILALMKRRYKSGLYSSRIEKIRELMPHASIGVDVITGFPGETREDFLETASFLHDLDVSYFHVFTYSERDNTEAIHLPGKVPVTERKERTRQLRLLSAKKQRDFYERFAGTEGLVLFEEHNKDGFMEGYTANYIRVRAPYDTALVNTPVKVMLQSPGADGLCACDIIQEHALI